MPELVANGPSIPVPLLNRLDSGGVVFFCGAGVSATPGSDLPRFAELVHHVYKANHVEPDGLEREALDCDEADVNRRRPSFDRALGLLERRLGTHTLRQTIIERLAVPATGDLTVHRALIDLSRNRDGVRLITTNFDNRFVAAGVPQVAVDAAPKLPVPKGHSWSSLVHLHGRILPTGDGSNLVLTGADFGRAYLTERWAARFVSEVFREFTVVFVGYSLSDPVMGYMVDALAAERSKGAQFAEAYAFADHDGTAPGEQRARDAWLAKNVTPMLYDRGDGDHRRLADTLIRWAEIRKDPFQARCEIALNGVRQMPSGPDDPLVERVTWALDDPTSAQALANSPSVEDEGEFAKIRAWLDRFSESGLLRCFADASALAGSSQDPAVVRLVDSGFLALSPETVDQTRIHLARWISRHLHVPQVLAWVLDNGGHMHPALCREIRMRLAEADLEVPPRLRLLWTVLLGHRPPDHQKFLWASSHYHAAASNSEQLRIEEDIVRGLEPRLVARSGPALSLMLERRLDGTNASQAPLDDCGHLEFVAGDEDAHDQVREILRGTPVLSRNALALTAHLEQALSLTSVAGDDERRSYLCRPSIATHAQNPEYGHDGWSHLIDLVRDSYLALAAVDRARADNLLRRWVLSRRPVFRRLALHALTENPKSDIRLSKDLLLAGNRPGLWDRELHREVLRFLRLAGSRLRRDLRVEVVRATHAGSRGMRKLPAPLIRREKALRLFKLAESGARLDKTSRALAAEVAEEIASHSDHREEFRFWHGESARISDNERPADVRYDSYRSVMAALQDQAIDGERLRALVLKEPLMAVAAVRRFAKQGKLPLPLWVNFLQSVAQLRDGQASLPKLRRSSGDALAHAPDELFSKASWAAAEFVQHFADDHGAEAESEFAELWTRAWLTIGDTQTRDGDFDDPITAALNHPAGKLAQAALTRLSKHEPTAGGGLPSPVKQYFNEIANDPNGELGRVMLVTGLLRLHSIDPGWTLQHLIQRLCPSRSGEARMLWSAYAWSGTIGPNLLVAFKDAFLEVLRGREGEDLQARLTGLFMAVCLELADQLSVEEVHSVVAEMSEGALQRVLLSLKQRMKGAPDERGRVWKTRACPWLGRYWPKVLARNTSATATSILDMLVETGDAFSDASGWALAYLCPLEGPGLRRLTLNNIPDQYPDEAFRLIKAVVADSVLPAQERHVLGRLLGRLKAACPALSQDPAFQHLYGFAAS